MSTWSPVGLELVRFFAQTLVIIAGWAVIHWLSGSRAKTEAQRKLLIEECAGLISLADGIFANALVYHTSTRMAADEQKLTMSLNDFTARLSLVLKLGNISDRKTLLTAAVEFKQACTLQHFEESHLHALALGDDLIRALEGSQLRIRLALTELRFELLTPTTLRR